MREKFKNKEKPNPEFDRGGWVEFSVGHRPTNSRPQIQEKEYNEDLDEWVYDLGPMGTVRENFLKRPEGYNYGQRSRGL